MSKKVHIHRTTRAQTKHAAFILLTFFNVTSTTRTHICRSIAIHYTIHSSLFGGRVGQLKENNIESKKPNTHSLILFHLTDLQQYDEKLTWVNHQANISVCECVLLLVLSLAGLSLDCFHFHLSFARSCSFSPGIVFHKHRQITMHIDEAAI